MKSAERQVHKYRANFIVNFTFLRETIEQSSQKWVRLESEIKLACQLAEIIRQIHSSGVQNTSFACFPLRGFHGAAESIWPFEIADIVRKFPMFPVISDFEWCWWWWWWKKCFPITSHIAARDSREMPRETRLRAWWTTRARWFALRLARRTHDERSESAAGRVMQNSLVAPAPSLEARGSRLKAWSSELGAWGFLVRRTSRVFWQHESQKTRVHAEDLSRSFALRSLG